MKKIFGLLLLTLTIYADGFTWQHDIDKAVELSKNSHKPIMMMYSAVWCGECDKMKNNVFKDPAINKSLQNDFVLLSYDIEQDRDRLPEGFSFRGVPTFFFIDSDKKLLKKAEGSSSKNSFLRKLKAVK